MTVLQDLSKGRGFVSGKAIARRELLVSAGAVSTVLLGAGELRAATAVRQGMGAAAGYFLSAANPIANVDQRDLEAMAVTLVDHPKILIARRSAAATFAQVTDRSFRPESLAMFEGMLDEYCFKSILEALVTDPNHPRILRVLSGAAKWLGNDVPSGKWGGDNPDNAYRRMALEFGGRYILHGQQQANPPSNVSYQLQTDSPALTPGTLDHRDIDIAPDGTFFITLDDTPAGGRKNHLQLSPEVKGMMVRDSMGNWRQTPNALWIERINAPSRGPVAKEEFIRRAAFNIVAGVYFTCWFLRIPFNLPPRTLAVPKLSGTVAGLASQVGSSGYFDLGDNEAAIITTNTAGAAYRAIVLNDIWDRSLDYRNHQSHLNNGFMKLDASGLTTFVISRRDPGVHNWLDTQGYKEIRVGKRWQALSTERKEDPRIETKIVNFSDLSANLPRGVAMVTPNERAEQLDLRRQLHDRRFIDS